MTTAEKKTWLWGIVQKRFGAVLGAPGEGGAIGSRLIRPIFLFMPVLAVLAAILGLIAVAGSSGGGEAGSSDSTNYGEVADTTIKREFDTLAEEREFNHYDLVIERLENQIDSKLADAALDPSRNTPQLNREIERLDYQIDMLRLNAMQNQSAEQRAAERHQENLDILEATRRSNKYYLDSDY
jgi:hypothetical protein